MPSMKQMLPLFFLVTTLVAVTAGCKGGARALAPDEAEKLLSNRIWIDRMPVDNEDRFRIYYFVPKEGGGSGVYQDRTLFAGRFELFFFEHDGKTIRFHLPQKKQRVSVAYRIDAVSDRAPFDLRLTLDPSPRGPRLYYGFRKQPESLAKRLGVSRFSGR